MLYPFTSLHPAKRRNRPYRGNRSTASPLTALRSVSASFQNILTTVSYITQSTSQALRPMQCSWMPLSYCVTGHRTNVSSSSLSTPLPSIHRPESAAATRSHLGCFLLRCAPRLSSPKCLPDGTRYHLSQRPCGTPSHRVSAVAVAPLSRSGLLEGLSGCEEMPPARKGPCRYSGRNVIAAPFPYQQ